MDNTGIISAIKTDHAAIVLQVNSVERQPTGPSHWKFNSSLLDDPEYINLINDNVPSWLVEFSDVLDKGLLWDLIKYKIRQVTMKYSKTKARERRSRLWEGDILSNGSKLKSWDAFREKNLSLSHYLLLQGMFSAIPPNWKLSLKDGENTNNQTDKTVSDNDVQDVTRMTSISIYSTLVKRIQIPPTAQSKFNSLYNISGTIDWKNIYLLPGRVTLDTRTRAFQYKILNRILYTNKILYKINLVPSPMGTFCGDHEETLEHLLISCAYTKNFWLSVISWLNTYNMKIDKLHEVTILFGISDNNPGNCLLNHMIILGKYTIYICRCKNIKPSLSLLKAKTTETRKQEKKKKKKKRKKKNLFITKNGKTCYCNFPFLTS